jgi:tRNA pseudouridine55 synthase
MTPLDPPTGAEPEPDEGEPEALPAWQRRLMEDRGAIIPLSIVFPRAPERPAAAIARALGDEPTKSGILVIDKPKGMTSHDVVKAIRRAASERRVGHAGTLDPMATGVLVVCIGSATRMIEEIQALPKRYGAEVRLGQSTDSYDAEGKVVAESDPSGVTLAQIESALAAFRGRIEQVPPMFSALRHEGERLYDLARRGEEVSREPRRLQVDELRVTAYEPPFLTLEMQVAKGFYVRSLAHDLGQALGCGAHLSGLVRTAIGHFDLSEAERLPRAVEAFVEKWWPAVLHPLDAAVLGLPALIVDADGEAHLRQGRQVPAADPGEAGPRARVYGPDGRLIGLAEWDSVHEAWQPTKIFPAAKPAKEG